MPGNVSVIKSENDVGKKKNVSRYWYTWTKKKKEKVSPVDERWTMKSERKELSIWRQQRLGENVEEEMCAKGSVAPLARRRAKESNFEQTLNEREKM